MDRKIKGCALMSPVILFCTFLAGVQDKPRVLALNVPLEQELAGQKPQGYIINLKPGQIARVVAEQRGIDVVLDVVSPVGKRLFTVDGADGTRGEETATICAVQKGAYRIEVRPAGPILPAGKYAICLQRFLSEAEYLTEKLASLCRLWGKIKYFHPFLAYKEIDWDAALIKTIPLVKAAHSPAEYSQAISDMLQFLNDPVTVVEAPPLKCINAVLPEKQKPGPVYFRLVEGYLIVYALDWAKAYSSGNSAAFQKQPQMLQEAEKSKGVLIECRGHGSAITGMDAFYLQIYLNMIIGKLVSGPMTLGNNRYRMHNGYMPQSGPIPNGYSSFFCTTTPSVISGQAQSAKPLGVLIDEDTPDMSTMWSGLQSVGARVVQVGKIRPGAGVTCSSQTILNGVRVRIRLDEFLSPQGTPFFHADVEIPDPAAGDDRVIAAAIASLQVKNRLEPLAAGAAPAVALRSMQDAAYSQMDFPAEEYRLLALFRFWNVIHFFSPYKQLIDKPWDSVLGDFIPRFLQNKSALDYEMTIAEMAARLQDTHGFVGGLKALDEQLGTYVPPIFLRWVEGKLMIAGFADDSSSQASGLKVGEAILAVDGEAIEQRLAYLSRFKSLSTPQAAYVYIYPSALRGAKDSKARLRVENEDKQVREIDVGRTIPRGNVAQDLPRRTPIYQVMANGYGYIDLARLPLADAGKALDAMMSTTAIIFDMRGYPNGTAWAIAPRLTEKKNITVALFRRPLLEATYLANEDFGEAPPDFSFEQKLLPAEGPVYKGNVVMLINEQAISQAEHTCLFFEAAASATFIGSPTSGTDGDVTNLVLPGGIYITFTGHDVRHFDGRQLQRIGIQPHIKVEPTIQGIREGRDEVLEAAVKFLDKKKL